MWGMKRLLLTSIAALFLATGTAHADKCATVLKTNDGFLALRDEPSVRAKLLLKLKKDEELWYPVKSVFKNWVRASYPGEDWENRGTVDGYVYGKYIHIFECGHLP
jgi:hypothetical protein